MRDAEVLGSTYKPSEQEWRFVRRWTVHRAEVFPARNVAKIKSQEKHMPNPIPLVFAASLIIPTGSIAQGATAKQDPYSLLVRYLSKDRAVVDFFGDGKPLFRCLATGTAPMKVGEYLGASCTKTTTKKIPAIFVPGVKRFISGGAGNTRLNLPDDRYQQIQRVAGIDKRNITVVVRQPATTLIPVEFEFKPGQDVRAYTHHAPGTKLGIESGLALSSFAPTVDVRGTVSLGKLPSGNSAPAPVEVGVIHGDQRHVYMLFPRKAPLLAGLGLEVMPVRQSRVENVDPGIATKIVDGLTEQRLEAALAEIAVPLLKDNAAHVAFAGTTCVIALSVAPASGGFSMTVCHGATSAMGIELAKTLPKHLLRALVNQTPELTTAQRARAHAMIDTAVLVVDAVTVLKDLYDFKKAANTSEEIASAVSAALGTAEIAVRKDDAKVKVSLGASKDNLGRMMILFDTLPKK